MKRHALQSAARLADWVDAVPPIRLSIGQPRWHRSKLYADKGYDHRGCRAALLRLRIRPCIARRGIDSKVRLGRNGLVVQRTEAWFGQFCCLAIRPD
ncbi:MAG TPA: hypothetical protein VEB20_10030 [Azospirillaceae bacterium]|nr:hypothetical protein [Azospirillaceae bacterium]